MWHLTNLQVLYLDHNPHLLTPPPEIIMGGIEAIRAFLRELQRSSTVRYESKLLIVGEGGTGKSSLLRALRAENFEQNLSTTHGIEISHLTLQHTSHTLTLLT